ncbi:phage tail tape measure protein [Neisseria animalis]|uniref:phage tail tape measure protein n=1 Tax=Neisseria animalis TaxID=492 RepID=UPI000F6DD9D9|nr:putative phage-related tail protein [Neisseria animalis]
MRQHQGNRRVAVAFSAVLSFGACVGNAWHAFLSNAFISLGKTPEVAGTAINGMLTKLMTADKQGKKFQAVLEGMGTDAKALKKAIAENGEQALMDFLRQIEKLPKENQMGALVDLFGLEYADDVAALVGGLDTYKKSIDELKKAGKGGKPEFMGSMEKEFAARSATTENGLTLMKNGFAELKTVVGDRLLPVINKVSAFIGNLTQNLADFAAKNPEVVDGLLLIGGVIAGLIIGFSAFTAVMGVFSMGWIAAAKAVSPMISLLGAVRKTMSFFGRGIISVIRFLPMLGSAFFEIGCLLNGQSDFPCPWPVGRCRLHALQQLGISGGRCKSVVAKLGDIFQRTLGANHGFLQQRHR